MNIFRQILLIVGILVISTIIQNVFTLPIPANVLGMIILLLLLSLGIVKDKHIENFTNFILLNLAFFFVPASVGLIDSYQLINKDILSIVAILTLSTFLTFTVTALFLQKLLDKVNK